MVTKLLYRSIENIVHVEILEVTVATLAIPLMIKLYRCGFANLNRCIRDAAANESGKCQVR